MKRLKRGSGKNEKRIFVFSLFLLGISPLLCFAVANSPEGLASKKIDMANAPPCDCKEPSKEIVTCHGAEAKLMLTVNVKKKELLIQPEGLPSTLWVFDQEPYRLWVSESAQLDLNQDGKVDAIVGLSLGGSGLASEFTLKILALSTPKGYVLWEIEDLSSLKDDFFRLGQGKRLAFLHTNYVRVDRCLDSKEHAFWMTQPIVFDGEELRIDNSLEPFYPLWVQFTESGSDNSEKLLSSTMKKTALRESGDDPEWYYFKKGILKK